MYRPSPGDSHGIPSDFYVPVVPSRRHVLRRRQPCRTTVGLLLIDADLVDEEHVPSPVGAPLEKHHCSQRARIQRMN